MNRLESFLEQCSPSESENTKTYYRSDILQFFNFCKKPPKNVKPPDLIEYVSSLKRERSSPATIHRKIAALKSYFKFLIYIEELDKNPIDIGLKIPRIKVKRRIPLTDEEVQNIIDKVGKEGEIELRNRAIIYLMLYNGLRRAEICNLRIGNLQDEGGMVTITIRGKGDKTRTRPLHKKCFTAIRNYLLELDRLHAPKKEPLFLTHRHAIAPAMIYHFVKRYAHLAGIKHAVHPHMFRAKFASMALESGVPITSVKEDLGHSKIDTTAMYDHSSSLLERSGVLKIRTIKEK